MSLFPFSPLPQRQCGLAAVAAVLLAPHVVAAGPISRAPPPTVTHSQRSDGSTLLGTVLNTEGVVELAAPTLRVSCEPSDTRLEEGRAELDAARAAREATRAQVVQDHLRVTQEPAATIETAQDEEDLKSAGAEVHNAKGDVRQDEDELPQATCTELRPAGPVPNAGDIAEVRMELPAQYLQPLQRALHTGSAAVIAYSFSDRNPITGRLISVESALAGDAPIVIARARLNDSLHKLRQAELVDVAVQLPAG